MPLTETERKVMGHYKSFFSYFMQMPIPPANVSQVAATLAAGVMTADLLDESIHELRSIANIVAGA